LKQYDESDDIKGCHILEKSWVFYRPGKS